MLDAVLSAFLAQGRRYVILLMLNAHRARRPCIADLPSLCKFLRSDIIRLTSCLSFAPRHRLPYLNILVLECLSRHWYCVLRWHVQDIFRTWHGPNSKSLLCAGLRDPSNKGYTQSMEHTEGPFKNKEWIDTRRSAAVPTKLG